MRLVRMLLLVGALCAVCVSPAFAAGQMLNINTATEEELAGLPAVGKDLAKSIVEYRENIGDIKQMDELLEVRGVTPDVLKKLKEVLNIEGIEGTDCNC